MITIQKWSGLITNASPYSLPGGACVSQVNLQCLKPGQIQCRQGMSTVGAASTVYVLNAPILCVAAIPGGVARRVALQAGSNIHIDVIA
jgi:hypothetical protein